MNPEDITTELAEKDKIIESVQADLHASRLLCANLQSEAASAKVSAADLSEKLANASTSLSLARDQLERMRNDHAAEVAALSAVISEEADLKDQIAKACVKIADLEHGLASVKVRATEIAQKHGCAKLPFDEAFAFIEQQASTIDPLRKEVARLVKDLREANEKVEEGRKTIGIQGARINDLLGEAEEYREETRVMLGDAATLAQCVIEQSSIDHVKITMLRLVEGVVIESKAAAERLPKKS